MNSALVHKLNGLIADFGKNYACSDVSHTVELPASEHRLHQLQAHLPVQLPSEYTDFLKYADGCTLFNYEDLDGFRFFGTSQFLLENIHVNDVYEIFDRNILVFCAVLGDGDFLGFRLTDGSYEILDCDHEEGAENWRSISRSFDGFLEQLIDAKGERFWL